MYSQPKQQQGGGEQKLFPVHRAVIVHQQEPHDEQGDHSIHIQPDTLQTRIQRASETGKGAALRRLACFRCGLLCGGKIAVINGSAPPIRLAARYRLRSGSPVRVPRAPSEPC